MGICRLTLLVALGVMAAAPSGASPGASPVEDPPASPSGQAPLFRVFLKDGSSLPSYSEIARLGDRVVFSMPTSPSDEPNLHLVDLPSARVDWERTERYAESVRGDRYRKTRGEADYAMLTTDIAQALNDIGQAPAPLDRLAVVEKARKTLADWPSRHYGYKQDEVRQMVGMIDEAIADLRAAAGAEKFDLHLVASVESPKAAEPILPPPSTREIIEDTLAAAKVTDSPAERTSLLAVALSILDRNSGLLPPEWLAATVAATKAAMAAEAAIDLAYQRLTQSILQMARTRAQAADVNGVQRLKSQIGARDKALGASRPDTVASILAEVDAQLDAARRLQLARDRWAIRQPELLQYRASMNAALDEFTAISPALESIKALSGSGPDALAAIFRGLARVDSTTSTVAPPDELREVHSLIVSAAQMADTAARIRREAALTGSLSRAWDASSAAAGALMLSAKARADLRLVLQLPQMTP